MAIGTTAALILGGGALAAGGLSYMGASEAADAAEAAAETSAESSAAAAAISAEASIYGANLEAEAQREALAYLKEREELPRQFSEGALTRLGGLYGLEGGTGESLKSRDELTQDALASPLYEQLTVGQDELIQDALASPLYGQLMGGKEAGEEAILRSAAATGGLRSGNVQQNLYDYNVQLENRALLDSYNQQVAAHTQDNRALLDAYNQQVAGYSQEISGLQGMAGLPSNAPEIAQQTSAIGTTLGVGQAAAGSAYAQGQTAAGQAYAQGQVASGQAMQQGYQGISDSIYGATSLGIQAYGAGMFSDRRLKKNIKKIGVYKGFNIYSWDWNIVANKMGLIGSTIGCMADEIYTEVKEAVSIKNMFMFVNYSKIGILLGEK